MNEASRVDLQRLDDDALVRIAVEDKQSRRGRGAASILFSRHHRRMFVWCLRMVRDHERALDLAQEAQITAWSRLESFSHEARFSSWLFIVVRNQCLSALRRVRLLEESDDGLVAMVDPAAGIDQRIEEEEAVRMLLELMDTELEPLEREALGLRCFEQLGVDAITEILGLDNATGARGLLQRARRRLRAARDRMTNASTGSSDSAEETP